MTKKHLTQRDLDRAAMLHAATMNFGAAVIQLLIAYKIKLKKKGRRKNE